MVKQFVHVTSGVVDSSPAGLPRRWQSGLQSVPGDRSIGVPAADLISAGWYPWEVEDTVLGVDQKYTSFVVTVEAGRVLNKRTAIAMTAKEISDRDADTKASATRNLREAIPRLVDEMAQQLDETALSVEGKATLQVIRDNL